MEKTKILIVEDELIAAESLALDLKRLGYQTSGIVDSSEKVEQSIDQNRPDLILMDIMLKGQEDGITIGEKIRHKYQIPVIYLTAYADAKTLKRATQTFPYGYLVKPYKAADLTTSIEIALHKYQDDQKTQQLLIKEKELNDLKNSIIAMISHDLRSPLTSILGTSEFIRKYGDKISEEKQEKCFDRIKLAIKNMEDLLKELLILNQADQEQIKVHYCQLDIINLFQELIEEFKPLITSNHQLKFVAPVKSFQGCFDSLLIHHILNNLISNAIKYSPQGGTITIAIEFPPNQIQFCIQDEGIGMSPEYYRDKLFKIFERGANVGNIQGTGLGLSIVKKIVDILQGNIEISSQENQGTRVTITLPLNQDCQENP